MVPPLHSRPGPRFPELREADAHNRSRPDSTARMRSLHLDARDRFVYSVSRSRVDLARLCTPYRLGGGVGKTPHPPGGLVISSQLCRRTDRSPYFFACAPFHRSPVTLAPRPPHRGAWCQHPIVISRKDAFSEHREPVCSLTSYARDAGMSLSRCAARVPVTQSRWLTG